jgi:hypothetical protein
MEDYLYRPKQNLEQIGPVYSTQDEKQRAIVKEILDLKIRPVMQININQNIPGLDKKKVIGMKNPATTRLWAPFAMYGRKGVKYFSHSYNISRFGVPAFTFLFYYYVAESYFRGTYYDKEFNNYENETCYFKMQTFNVHYTDKSSLMA